jgi:release factor glutamine methyltransferase
VNAAGSFVVNGAARLRSGPHPDRARQDAEILLLHILEKGKAWLMAHGDEELSGEQAAHFMELLERRYRGEPMQYILGRAEFYGLSFRVIPDVLIPRPETEHLVEKVIEIAGGVEAPRIVDVGTGSGCIAIALAHQLPGATITAIDFSGAALTIAQENAERNGLAHRIRFLQGDLLDPVAGHQFDIVVSNPPYVSLNDRGSLAVEVRDHEPGLALFAGDDGLDIYRRLIPAAFSALVPDGFAALEIGHGQSQVIAGLLTDAGFDRIEFVPDLQSIPRVAVARRPAGQPHE